MKDPKIATYMERLRSLPERKRELFLLQLKEMGIDLAALEILPQPRRGDGTDAFPLSFAQQRLWFLHQMEPTSSAYHVSIPKRLAGPLAVAALEGALAALVARHETLRTTFEVVEGEPVQRIRRPAEAGLALPVVDLSGLAEGEREALVPVLVTAAGRHPFDLATGPVLRPVLLRLGAVEHAFLLTLHHIVSDAWSLALFFRELIGGYTALVGTGALPVLPELPVQYADFAQWQRQRLDGGGLEAQLEYWRERLGERGQVPHLELPTDRPRGATSDRRGATLSRTLDGAVSDGVRRLAMDRETTPYTVLLAAYQVLLARLAGQEDFAVGSTVANRGRDETEGLIGFFVNTLVLRTPMVETEAFGDFLDRVRATVLEANAHQDLPFEKLVEALQPERSLQYAPLFQVSFNLLTAGGATAVFDEEAAPAAGTGGGEGLQILPLRGKPRDVPFDLTLRVNDPGGGGPLTLSFDYKAALFDGTRIQRMLGQLARLLAGAVADTTRRVAALPLLAAAERHQLTVEWNHTDRHWPFFEAVEGETATTLHGMVAAQARRTPEAPAVRFAGAVLTFAALEARATALARVLVQKGVTVDAPVAVRLERSLDLPVALLAVLKAGGAYLPLDPSYPPDRLAFMLADAEVTVLLTDAPETPDAAGEDGAAVPAGVRVVRLPEALAETGALTGSETLPTVRGDNLAYLIYTSGSTGRPKGAMVPHGAVANRMRWLQWQYGLTAADRVLQKTPVSFDVSVWELFWPLTSGATTVLAAPGGQGDPAYLARAIVEEGITTCHFVPSMLRLFLETPGAAGTAATLRRLVVSGEALTADLVAALQRTLPVPAHNMYGPSEAARATFVSVGEDFPQFAVYPIGWPVPHNSILLLDRRGEPVPLGCPGELCIGNYGGEGRRQEAPAASGTGVAGRRQGSPGTASVNSLRSDNLQPSQQTPAASASLAASAPLAASDLSKSAESANREEGRRQGSPGTASVNSLRSDILQPSQQTPTASAPLAASDRDAGRRQGAPAASDTGVAATASAANAANPVGRGYRRRPRLTARRFVPDPTGQNPGGRLYRTGDLCRFLVDGRIEFLGRIDFQVKVRGIRVELGEIDATLESHPGIRDAVTVVRERTPGDQRLVAFYVAREGMGDGAEKTALDAGELRRFLGSRLPDVMVPATFVALDALPLTPSGKVDRGALPREVPGVGESEERPEHTPPRGQLEEAIAAVWREVLGLDSVGVEENFFDLGGHSLLLIRVQGALRERLEREIPVVELFQFPTIAALARHLQKGKEAVTAADAVADAAALRAAAEAKRRRRSTGTGLNDGDDPLADAVAIVAMACRFPGADTPEQFWQNLRGGVESVTFFSREELLAEGIPAATLDDPRYVPARATVEHPDHFDATLFRMPPREAEITDPQHRLFLEVAWEALERAGCDPATYPGAVGVFAGVGISRYWLNLLSHPELLERFGVLQLALANEKDYLPTRVAYKLGLTGPAVNVQTACSTSLVATHLACRSLLEGECDTALAGGVAVVGRQKAGYLFAPDGIGSSDGHCRAYDARGEGTIGGNGAGIVVLKRLADAVADGDRIHAVIRGSSINNDGAAKVGFTAPSVEGQAAVIAAAQAAAGVPAASVAMIEGHGTATPLGDPIEVRALQRVFAGLAPGSVALGSVKTNFGHLSAAAGVAGLMKAALAVEHGEIPPSLHFETPNPEMNLDGSPIFVNTRTTPFPGSGPRRAGVSSFGLGGTNVHMVLESAPQPQQNQQPEQVPATCSGELLVLSAASPSALDATTEGLATFLETHPESDLKDVAHTLHTGRRRLPHRRTLVATSGAEAVAILRGNHPTRLFTAHDPQQDRAVAFLLPGVGDHYPGMTRGLYDEAPIFRDAVDRCLEHLNAVAEGLGDELRGVLVPAPSPQTPSPQTPLVSPGKTGEGLSESQEGGIFSTAVEEGGERGGLGARPGKPSDRASTETAEGTAAPARAESRRAPKDPGIEKRAPVPGTRPEALPASSTTSPKLDLRRLLGRSGTAENDTPLHTTRLAQPAVFVVSYALAQLWRSRGVEPEALIGYSLGEYTAACLAGVLSLEDALHLVAERARLIDALPEGAMVAVPLGEGEMGEMLQSAGLDLAIAATNGPRVTVVAGTVDAAETLRQVLEDREIVSQRLASRHAFHSPLLEGAVEGFRAVLGRVALAVPKIPVVSNVTGGWLTAAEATDPEYWVRHMLGTVRFTEGLQSLLEEGERALLEVGPGQALTTSARQHPAFGAHPVATSVRDARLDTGDGAFFREAAGRLWLAGVPVRPAGSGEGEKPRKVLLPTYPFERQRYRVEMAGPLVLGSAGSPRRPAGEKNPRMEAWFHTPTWRLAPPLPPLAGEALPPGPWLLLPGEGEVSTAVAAALRDLLEERGATVVDGLEAGPRHILHLANLEPPSDDFAAEQDRGLHAMAELVAAFAHHPALTAEGPVALTVATTGAFADGDRGPSPARAALVGALKVLPQEYRDLPTRHVDVAGIDGPEAIARRLLAEALQHGGDGADGADGADREPTVRLRQRSRYLPGFDPLPLPPVGERVAPGLRPGGVYLLTGAHGRVGRVLTRYLAERAGAKLVLLARTPVPPREEWEKVAADDPRIAHLQALETLGAAVLPVAGDVADGAAVTAAVAAARERFGALHGVIHLAGLTGSLVPAEQADAQACAPHFHAKVAGLAALEAALESSVEGEDLDFVLLFSSLAAVLGGLGFTAYAAANSTLDAWVAAHNRRHPGQPWTAVNWDGWPQDETVTDPQGLVMTPAEGAEAFHRVLAMAGTDRIVVSLGDLEARLDRWVRFRQQPSTGTGGAGTGPTGAGVEDEEARGGPSLYDRPQLQTPYVEPQNETEVELAALWGDLLGIRQIGIHDNFFELGGDSLLATQLVSRLRGALQVELPLALFFNVPTIAQLAAAVAEREYQQEELSEIEATLKSIQDLSPEEAEALLAQMGEE
jgi:amino acid adenylation domain-containing protein